MKVLVVHRVNKDKYSVKGIYQKLVGICKGFRENNCQVDELCPGNDGIYFNGIRRSEKGIYGEDRVFYDLQRVVKLQSYDWIYIRFAPLSFWLFSVLKKLKRLSPNSIVILEFANYPFEYELPFIKRIIFQLFFKARLEKLNKYVDYALHLGVESTILGIPAIRFDNGFDIKSVRPKVAATINESARMLYVGTLWPWQGLEDLILDIKLNGPSTGIDWVLTIVGDGPHKADLVQFIRGHNMQHVVEIVSPAHGQALDELFDGANFGVGTLRNSRRKLPYAANLKHRHYATRGLPFFVDVPDFGFSSCQQGYFQFSNGDERIQILADWLKKSSLSDVEATGDYLRKYAATHFDWKIVIEKVIRKVKDQP